MSKKRKSNKNYFTQETEQAIIEYNNSDDPQERNRIYEDKIHYPFFKLTQNIIHTFKFYNTEVDKLEDLQHEIIIFLLQKMHLFNPDKGFKAYSYFGTIVKNYLIIYNNKNYAKKINNFSFHNLNSSSNTNNPDSDPTQSKIVLDNIDSLSDSEFFDEDLDLESEEENKLYFFTNKFVDYVTEHIYELFPKEYDAKIADSILEIFRKRDQIENFNKKALYIYIREMVDDAKTPKITKITKKLYKIFKTSYINYLDTGSIYF